MPSNPEDRRSAASVRLSGGLASMAATTRTFATTPTSWRRCCWPPTCCSHHLQPKEPDPAIDRGSVGVSFSSSHKVGSSSKRCLPAVKIRCVLAGRHSPRTIWSTLPARRVDLRGFTSGARYAVEYLPRSNASRVSHRVLTAGQPTRRRCATMSPSRRHGRAPCGRQPWRVHAHGRLSGIARCQKHFLLHPLDT